MPYVPYQKRSKKGRRETDQAKRATWGSVSPVTKKVESAKAYNRKKIQRWQKEWPRWIFCLGADACYRATAFEYNFFQSVIYCTSLL